MGDTFHNVFILVFKAFSLTLAYNSSKFRRGGVLNVGYIPKVGPLLLGNIMLGQVFAGITRKIGSFVTTSAIPIHEMCQL